MNKPIHFYVLDTPIFIKMGPFSGFSAKFVMRLDGENRVIGVNPNYLRGSNNKLPGLGQIVTLIEKDTKLLLYTKPINYSVTKELHDPLVFDVDESVTKLILDYINDNEH